jgi:integrase
MGTGRSGGVRTASETTIEIDFYYRGARCRERVKLAPTSRNMRYAENLLGQIKVEIEKGSFDYHTHFPNSRRAKKLSHNPGELETVESALERWFARKGQELEHSTLQGYRRIIYNVLAPACGRTLLRDFDRAAGRALIDGLGAEVSVKRINNVLGPLRGMFADLVDDGILATNPMDGLKVRRRGRIATTDDIDPFTPVEIRTILNKCADPHFQNYCQFNFATGLRTSEMIGLEWGDIDFITNTVRIRRAFVMGKMKAPKTEAGIRVVELTAPALQALRAQKALTFLAGGTVFLNPRSGEQWKGDRDVRRFFWTPLLKAAGVRYRYPYQMRHTFASIALSAGEAVMWVAKQMGHRDWTITAKKYSRWIPSIVPDAGGKMEAVWSGQNADQKADQTPPILAQS